VRRSFTELCRLCGKTFGDTNSDFHPFDIAEGVPLTSAPMNHQAIFTTPQSTLPFHIHIASSLDEFAGRWPTTADRGNARCYPFQCADVLQIWCETIGRSKDIEPIFAAVHAAKGEPLFLFPFGIERANGVRILRFLDHGVSDYNAPVVYPEAAGIRLEGPRLWKRLRECLPPFDLAALEKMPESIEGVPNPLSAIATASHPESCHGIALHGVADDFEHNHLPNARFPPPPSKTREARFDTVRNRLHR
jgi:CelD/BcsL family acetyltransferase involved in cellulose biosynthesis